MLFNLNELGKQTKACFRLFMQSWKAVFVSCVSFFSKLFGHCDKSNASVSLNCMLISSQWKLRNAEPVETLFPLCFSPQEKKKVFLKSWCLLSCVPQVTLTFSTRQAVDSDELLLDPGQQRNVSSQSPANLTCLNQHLCFTNLYRLQLSVVKLTMQDCST